MGFIRHRGHPPLSGPLSSAAFPGIALLCACALAGAQVTIPITTYRRALCAGISTSDGGGIAVGNTNQEGKYPETAWLVKLDKLGDNEWTAGFGRKGADYFNRIKQVQAGGYIMVGRSNAWTFRDNDMFAAHADAGGSLVWQQEYSSLNEDAANDVCELATGGFVMTGVWDNDKCGVVRVDVQGNLVWQKVYGNREGFFVDEREDGTIMVAARNGDVSRLIFIDIDGNTIDEVALDRYKDIAVEAVEDGYLATGNFLLADTTTRGFGLAKVDYDGDIVWEKVFGGGTGMSIGLGTSNEVMVCGKDGAAAKYVRASGTGDSLWTVLLGDGSMPWALRIPDFGWHLRYWYTKSSIGFIRDSPTWRSYANEQGEVDTFEIAITRIPGVNPAGHAFAPGAGPEVTLTCGTEGATIHYTLDGRVPAETSPAYSQPLSISTTTVLRCRAYKAGYSASAVKTERYVLDNSGPTFSSASPAENANNASVIDVIDGVLSEPIAPQSLSMASFRVYEQNGRRVPGRVQYVEGSMAVRFIPNSRPEYPVIPPSAPTRYLKYATTYVCTLTTAITDTVGNSPASPLVWHFTTIGPESDRKNCLAYFTSHTGIGRNGSYTWYEDTTWLEYDAQNRVTKIRNWRDEDSAYFVTTMEYGPNGPVRRCTFDKLGNLSGYETFEYGANGDLLLNYRYNADSALTEYVTHEYDSLGLLSRQAYFNADASPKSMTTYTYAAHGGVTAIVFGLGDSETRRYDQYYNHVGTTSRRGDETGSSFDEFNRMMQSGSTYYRYDEKGRLAIRQFFGDGYTSNTTMTYNEDSNIAVRHSGYWRLTEVYHYVDDGAAIRPRAAGAEMSAPLAVTTTAAGRAPLLRYTGVQSGTPLTIRAFDMRGRTVWRTDLVPRDGTAFATCEVVLGSGAPVPLAHGAYVVEARNGARRLVTRALVSGR